MEVKHQSTLHYTRQAELLGRKAGWKERGWWMNFPPCVAIIVPIKYSSGPFVSDQSLVYNQTKLKF